MKRKVFLIFISIVMCSYSLCSCTKKEEDLSLPDGMLLGQSDAGDYKFQYPETWDTIRQDGMFAIKSKTSSSVISASCYTLKKDSFSDAEKYIYGENENAGYLSVIEQTFGKDYTLTSVDDITIDRIPSKSVKYHIKTGDDEYDIDTVLVFRTSESDGETTLYSLTFTALSENYKEDTSIFKTVTDSFVFD